MIICRNYPPYFTTICLFNAYNGDTVTLERVIYYSFNNMKNIGLVIPNDPLYTIGTT